MILALDLGTKLGYYREREGAKTYDLGKGDGRFSSFYYFLHDMDYDLEYTLGNRITTVVYEGAAHQKGFAMPLYHGLVGVLKLFCHNKGIPLEAIHAMTVKKAFTGKGMWKKKECEEMNERLGLGLPKSKITKAPMIACIKGLGVEYEDDNSVDAYAVWYAYNQLKLGVNNDK